MMNSSGTNAGSAGSADSGEFRAEARELNHVGKVIAVVKREKGKVKKNISIVPLFRKFRLQEVIKK